MNGYFAYTAHNHAFDVDVRVYDQGTHYRIEFKQAFRVPRRPLRSDLPANCLWYVELADGRVFVNRNGWITEGLLLEPSLESVLL